jgi:DNA-binding response OmpR family regulator
MSERILIVDDEASIHEVARAYLEGDGFIVYSAYDGREGLDIALTRYPALIVLDLMPARPLRRARPPGESPRSPSAVLR